MATATATGLSLKEPVRFAVSHLEYNFSSPTPRARRRERKSGVGVVPKPAISSRATGM